MTPGSFSNRRIRARNSVHSLPVTVAAVGATADSQHSTRIPFAGAVLIAEVLNQGPVPRRLYHFFGLSGGGQADISDSDCSAFLKARDISCKE
jgi:hypothetical protein